MCLKIKYKEEPLVAKKPIKCYKVVSVFTYESHETQIFSPLYRYQYRLNELAGIEMFVTHHRLENCSFVAQGFHSFINKKDATKFAEKLNQQDGNVQAGMYEYKVMAFIIPVNSKYYLGTFTMVMGRNEFDVRVNHFLAYASNKVIPKQLTI